MACYLDTKISIDCCGCRACEHTCNLNAIQMVKNEEGFLYPLINEKLCANCGGCRMVCPMAANIKNSELIGIYATQNKDEKKLKKSSSGGMFIIFAEHIINTNGIVFGSTFDSEFRACQTSAKSFDELLGMQGSKYVQSDTVDSYKKVKKYLEKDNNVLYTGTPCQISGLKLYLKKEYRNLFTIDFLCHGVPSPKIFCNYIKGLEKKRKGKLIAYNFRDKKKKGWGLVAGYEINHNGKTKKYYESGELNSYLYGFTKGYFNRNSCYKCPFKGKKHSADITIADYWGIKRYHPEFNAEKGVSIVMINTEKGKDFFEDVNNKMLVKATSIDYAAQENGGLKELQELLPIPNMRNEIFKILDIKSYNFVEKEYLKTPRYMKLWWIDKMPRSVIKIGKLILRK